MLPIRRTRFFGRRRSRAARASANRTSIPAVVINPNSGTARRSSAFPAALPCKDVRKLSSELKCPLGKVVIKLRKELQPWLSITLPVSKEEAEQRGGFIEFIPASNDGTSQSSATVQRSYYLIQTDDVVYGRSRYLPLPPKVHRTKVLNPSMALDQCRRCCRMSDEKNKSDEGDLSPSSADLLSISSNTSVQTQSATPPKLLSGVQLARSPSK